MLSLPAFEGIIYLARDALSSIRSGGQAVCDPSVVKMSADCVAAGANVPLRDCRGSIGGGGLRSGGMQGGALSGGLRGGGMLSRALFCGLRGGGMLSRALGRLRGTTARGFLSQTLFFPCMERTWFREFPRSVWTRADVVS